MEIKVGDKPVNNYVTAFAMSQDAENALIARGNNVLTAIKTALKLQRMGRAVIGEVKLDQEQAEMTTKDGQKVQGYLPIIRISLTKTEKEQ